MTGLRRSMHRARKERIWTRDGGRCWLCLLPVEMTGPGVRYDHRNPLWITEDDSDEGISPSHTACDAPKTAIDQGVIAKVKRIIRKADPATRRKGNRPIPSRPFQTSLKANWPSRKFQSQGKGKS